MKQFCIVIPIYKNELDCIEKISIESLKREIENKYNIYFVCPRGINKKPYLEYFENAKFVYFSKSFFKNLKSYSMLCMSYDFYDKFSEYEYMIIYQLDCYLFRDEFKKWCNKGYDYIGGPIFSPNAGWNLKTLVQNGETRDIPKVGNGGFSLRKIQTFKDICDPEGELRTEYNISNDVLKKIKFEDIYFCDILSNIYELKKPDWKTACKFSLDMNVDVFYRYENPKNLPMGVHAWDKNIRYWKNIIPELIDNKEVEDFCEEKHKEMFKIYYEEN